MEKRNKIFKHILSDLKTEFDLEENEARTFAKKALVEFHNEGSKSISFASNLCNNKKGIKCDPSSRFRTIEGNCNNLDNPYWGAFGVPFLREIEVDPYDPNTEITIMDKIQGMLH